MKPSFTDDDAREQTLDELMHAMDEMDAKRVPGVTITISPNGKEDDPAEESAESPEQQKIEDAMGVDDHGMPPPPEDAAMVGMDPRLMEIIRKARSGAR